MTNTMAFAISTPTPSLFHSSSSSSSTGRKSTYVSSTLSNSAISIPKNAIFKHIKGIPQLGFTQFSQWSGLKQMGVSISRTSVKMEKKGKCKGRVYASLFGVGAPEVLVIGVVALLVFGPKGLAEVARNLGKTLRAFQPTIRELQEVSREFKSTLEQEIGLNDINTPVPNRSNFNTTKPKLEDTPEASGTNVEPNGSVSESGAYSTEDYLKVSESQLKGALARLQKEQEEEQERAEKEKAEVQSESSTLSQDIPQALDAPQEVASAVTPPSQNPESKPLEEAPSVTPPAPAPKVESET